MSWLQRVWRAATDGAPARDPLDDFWYERISILSAAGQPVTPDRAIQLPAVESCLLLLAQPIASLPLMLYRRNRDGSRTRVDDHPLFDLLHTQPNERQSAYEFRAQMQWNLAFHRNAYAEIRPGARGAVGSLLPVHPSFVTVERRDSGEIWYRIRDDRRGRERILHEQEIWHLRAPPFTSDGIAGVPTFESKRELFGAALALQDYAARYFANDGQSGGIIEHAGTFKTDEDRTKFMTAWRAARTGGHAHRDALLEFGAKYNRFSPNNEQAQFLETRKELDVRIAAIWNIQPHKLGNLDRATFSNIEQLGLEFVTQTLAPWIKLWEQAIRRDLIIGPGYYAEFNLDGLLRGDLLSRYQAFAIGRNWGWLSANEVRARENMDAIEDGDTYMAPANMVPADSLLAPSPAPTRERDANVIDMRSFADV